MRSVVDSFNFSAYGAVFAVLLFRHIMAFLLRCVCRSNGLRCNKSNDQEHTTQVAARSTHFALPHERIKGSLTDREKAIKCMRYPVSHGPMLAPWVADRPHGPAPDTTTSDPNSTGP